MLKIILISIICSPKIYIRDRKKCIQKHKIENENRH